MHKDIAMKLLDRRCEILIYSDDYEEQLRKDHIIDDSCVFCMRLLEDYDDKRYEMVYIIYNSRFKDVIIRQINKLKNTFFVVIFQNEIDLEVAKMVPAYTKVNSYKEIKGILRMNIMPCISSGLIALDCEDIRILLRMMHYFKYCTDINEENIKNLFVVIESNDDIFRSDCHYTKQPFYLIIQKIKKIYKDGVEAIFHFYNKELEGKPVLHYIFSKDIN